MGELLFELDKHKRPSWMAEFCQCPTPLYLSDNNLRIFISTRSKSIDSKYISNTGYLDFDISGNNYMLKKISPTPILPLGGKGTFDEHGLMVSSIYIYESDIYLFYTGWNRKTTVPYSMSIGLAISSDGGETFRKISQGPILSVDRQNPYFVTGPSVRRFNNIFYMWYSTATGWFEVNGRLEPKYSLTFATSDDLINWQPSGELCIPESLPGECQVSFAVFFDEDSMAYYSFYCFRDLYKYKKDFRNSSTYQIGLVKSDDLITWSKIENKNIFNTVFGESYWDN